MKTYQVSVKVNVPAYATVEIEATSQEEAVHLAMKQIDEEEWGSDIWQEGVFTPVWDEADDLCVIL